MSYVYMKVLESAPARYDRGMRLLTLGRLDRVHQDIATWLRASGRAGPRVLDVGCGTAALVVQLARQGCQVTGIDVSRAMLAQAEKRVRAEGLQAQVTLRELGIAELDMAFEEASFDAVTATLVLSELSPDERDYLLAQARKLLMAEGWLLVADEVLPGTAWGRVATALLRLPFQLLAYLLTQNTTRRVANLGPGITRAGYRLVETRSYLAGTLRLFVARKEVPA